MNIREAVRSAAVALIAAATLAGTTQAASAATSAQLTADLAALWTKVLETPSDQNPFGNPNANACWDLGKNVVSPFGPSGVESCTVKPGTRLFVLGWSVECSTFEEESPPCGPDLSSSAKAATPKVTSVTVDGRTVLLSEVLTSRQPITLPPNNLFGVDAGSRGEFVADGWVTLLHPLTPGTHEIVGPTFTTTIVVQPGLT
jgi:hypothetical protein